MMSLYAAYDHAIEQKNFINILYSNLDFKTFTWNLHFIFVFLNYFNVLCNVRSKNTSLKAATISGRNLYLLRWL